MPEHSLSAGGCYPDAPLFLNGCGKYKYPRFDKECIWFNGGSHRPSFRKKIEGYWEDTSQWRDSDGNLNSLDHETFAVSRTLKKKGDYWETGGGFCKTARKPYDLMVKACLLVLLIHLGDRGVEISSDGDYDEDNWGPATRFVIETFGEDYLTPEIMNRLIA